MAAGSDGFDAHLVQGADSGEGDGAFAVFGVLALESEPESPGDPNALAGEYDRIKRAVKRNLVERIRVELEELSSRGPTMGTGSSGPP